MARDDPHFRLRIPAKLKEKIELFAKVNNRSINAEIVSRLESSFAPQVNIEIPNKSDELIRAIEQFAGTIALEALKAAGYPVDEFSESDRDKMGKAFVPKVRKEPNDSDGDSNL